MSDTTCDLFVSYAQADNTEGWVTRFVDALKAAHRRIDNAELSVFFDTQSIATMQDWEHRIFAELKSAKLLVAFLSPDYFASDFCRREMAFYLEHERHFPWHGEGVAPVYLATAPEIEGKDEPAEEWLAELRRRQRTDFREWFSHGLFALGHEDVQAAIELLDQQLSATLDRADRAADSRASVPTPNPRFVGRRDELRRLRETLTHGRVGAITAVQGIGGIGKTALAYEYAHVHADEYPGGRLLVNCETASDLRLALMAQAERLGLILTEGEQKDPDLAYARIHTRLEAGPRRLLLLDNVSQREQLAEQYLDVLLPSGDQLHVIATTRLDPHDFHAAVQPAAGAGQPTADGRIVALVLDRLDDDDAVALLGRYRRQTGDDEAAARRIVTRLGGWTLAVEVVAVYLSQYEEVTYQDLADTLEAEGLELLEEIGGQVQLSRHRETHLTKLLAPTLQTLSDPELLALRYAALLPPDAIPLPWLRELVGQDHPALLNPRPGRPDPWRQVERRLMGLRLLAPGDEAEVARMHRLVQEIIRRADAVPEEERLDRLAEVARRRGEEYVEQKGWGSPAGRWEFGPLVAVARRCDELARPVAGELLGQCGAVCYWLARWPEGEAFLRRAMELDEATYGSDHPRVADHQNNLGRILYATNRLAGAELLFRAALANHEAAHGSSHPHVATDMNDLATVLQAANQLTDAEPLFRRALAIDEASYGRDHPDAARDLNNLALLLKVTNRFAEAEPLYRRALAIHEATYGPNHPEVATNLNNLASLLQATNRMTEAEPLYRRALSIVEASFGTDHPRVAATLNNLARLLKTTNRAAEAEPLCRRALEILTKFTGATGHEHTKLAMVARNYELVLIACGVPKAQARERVKAILRHGQPRADAPTDGAKHTDCGIPPLRRQKHRR